MRVNDEFCLVQLDGFSVIFCHFGSCRVPVFFHGLVILCRCYVCGCKLHQIVSLNRRIDWESRPENGKEIAIESAGALLDTHTHTHTQTHKASLKNPIEKLLFNGFHYLCSAQKENETAPRHAEFQSLLHYKPLIELRQLICNFPRPVETVF